MAPSYLDHETGRRISANPPHHHPHRPRGEATDA